MVDLKTPKHPFKINWPLEEGPEHNNKNVRDNREHHARQKSLQLGLLDAFHRDCYGCDPRILRIIEESINREKPEIHLSQAVRNLLESDDSAMTADSDDSNDSDNSDDSDGFFIRSVN